MLQAATLDFLKQLGKNNDKAWFDKNRKAYEAAKDDFEEFIGGLLQKLTKLEERFSEQQAKDTIFRIFRDVRFSKDKTPYKAHFSAYLSRAGRKSPDAGYYLHIEPGKSFLAGGIWQPEGPLLKGIRQEIDYNFKEFTGILNNKDFKKQFKNLEGEELKKVPPGYAADNPAADYLKKKSFMASQPLADKDLTAKNFGDNLVKTATVLKPLVDFMNRPLD